MPQDRYYSLDADFRALTDKERFLKYLEGLSIQSDRYLVREACKRALLNLGRTSNHITQATPSESTTVDAHTSEDTHAGIVIAHIKSILLPVNKQALTPGGNCEIGFAVMPKTALGKAVHAAGWHVMNEITINKLLAVTAFASAEDGTSGSCYINDSVVFASAGNDLYELKRLEEQTKTSTIIAQPYRGKAIRIHGNSPYDVPIAELSRHNNDNVKVNSLPPSEHECNGAVSIPFILGLTVSSARERLKADNWLPLGGHAAEELDFRTKEYQNAGFPEFFSCSGTGFAFCTLAYQHPTGARLEVVTIGEVSDPDINDWNIECKPKH